MAVIDELNMVDPIVNKCNALWCRPQNDSFVLSCALKCTVPEMYTVIIQSVNKTIQSIND